MIPPDARESMDKNKMGLKGTLLVNSKILMLLLVLCMGCKNPITPFVV